MWPSTSPKTSLAALVLLACANTIEAHSWVKILQLIDSSGAFVGAIGYPRGFVPQTLKGWTDFMAENKVPPDGRPTGSQILPTDLMCAPYQQIGNQTAGFPTLTAAPGDFIALSYQENGHVTKNTTAPPNTRPAGNGTIFIYGTKTPANSDTYLGIHRVWNTEGTGGDKRGKLLATRYFDDGQCYQISAEPMSVARQTQFNNKTEIPCQNDLQLPTDAGTSGKYSLYWVWEYPTMHADVGGLVTNESYTTCMDISMTSTPVAKNGDFKANQQIGSAAIKAQLDQAIMVNPTAPLVILGASPAPLTGPSSQPASGNPSSAAAPGPSSQPAAGNPASSVASANVPATPPAQTPPYSSVPPQQPSSAPSPQAPSTVTVTVTVHDGGSGSSAGAPAATPQPTTLATSAAPQAGKNPASMSSASAPAPSNSPSVVFVAPSSLSPAPFNIGSQAATPAASAPAALQRRRAL
ncbi:hypothetical protein LCER1_G005577 [Lachnellula cervina]|uniref:DUF7492 domain-containing protein n=1 Tax=Lachnellula cervina TaxID=1316786 RepID=A0A7D8YNA4_9HELO|nr:hypothetical protein LCER1_G005577 [Lachnellula cervina]